MKPAARARRLTYLLHRWTGIAGCLLMALWFLSGMVMLFVGYPKLTPWERLGALPPLAAGGLLSPEAALAADIGAAATLGASATGAAAESAQDSAAAPGAQPAIPLATARSLVLTTIAGQPRYLLRQADGRFRTLQARDANPPDQAAGEHDGTGKTSPIEAALAEARSTLPGIAAHYAGQVTEDRWTHSRGLDAHRPLHKVEMESGGQDPAGGGELGAVTLYVSGTTGQLVLDAPLAQQRWNYLGAWLHWLYLFRDRSVDPAWSWTVILLSTLCTLTTLSGTIVGLWRWRFGGRYASGSHSPYRAGWMRWHHLIGLLCAGFVCTWIFSGLMSMNPLRIFDPAAPGPRLAAYQGGPLPQPPAHPASGAAAASLPQQAAAPPARAQSHPPGDASPGTLYPAALAIRQLHAAGFEPVELAWRSLAGQPYLHALDTLGNSRLLDGPPDAPRIRETWSEAEILQAAARLFDAPIAHHQRLDSHDAYYYARHAEAMNGAQPRRLPALRLDFADASQTRLYIDLHSGDIEQSLSRSQRVSRWLFYFLHSWDLPALLALGSLRDAMLILLSLGGLALAVSGTVIGWRRLRRNGRGGKSERASPQARRAVQDQSS